MLERRNPSLGLMGTETSQLNTRTEKQQQQNTNGKMAATTSGTEKTRAILQELVGLAFAGDYAKADAIMSEYGAGSPEDEAEAEWDRKCAEAVKNGAVLKGLRGTADHSIQYFNSKGQLHRENGPAQEFRNGSKGWMKNGLHHREDGPAVIFMGDNAQYWVGNSCVPNLPTPYGDEWDLKCLQAVIDGATIQNGAIVYLKDGQKHNETGPAVKYHDNRSEVWINGKCLASTNE